MNIYIKQELVKDSKISCARCGEIIESGKDLKFGDPKAFYEGEPLCELCYYEDEPVAKVFYGREKEPFSISYTRNPTDGDFWVEWKPTDPWRGRYEVKSKKFKTLFSDSILAYHESEKMLKELNDLVIERFDDLGIDYARSFARTSNVFCTDFDIWAKDDLIYLVKGLVVVNAAKGAVGYHNPEYSTGIVFGREALKELQNVLGGRYDIKTDGDVVNIIREKGDEFIEELKNLYEEKL